MEVIYQIDKDELLQVIQESVVLQDELPSRERLNSFTDVGEEEDEFDRI